MWCSEARQYTRSNDASTKGRASASPCWSRTLVIPAWRVRSAAQRQQLRGEIEGHHLTHVRGRALGQVGGAARHLQRDQVGGEGSQPGDGVGPTRER